MTAAKRTTIVALFLGCAAALALSLPAAAQKKGGGKTEPQHWPCQLTLRDGVDEAGHPADAIVSDGWGTYINGQDGNRVRCKIADAPGSAHDGWLEMWIDPGSVRYMLFPGRDAQNVYTRSGYSTFENRGSFQVKVIRTADVVGDTYLRPFRAEVEHAQFGGRYRLMGDSFAVAPDRFSPDLRGTSSVFVQVLDGCTWQVTSDPARDITPGEGAQHPRVIGLIESHKNGVPYRSADFTMPFSATVRIIGVKPGCGGA